MKIFSTILLIAITTNLKAQAPGGLDPTFGIGGKVITSIGGEDKAYGVVLQSDDKIIIAGYSTSTVTGKDFVLVRYNPDGTPDDTFGNGGVVTTDLQLGSDDVAYCLTLQGDGRIVAGGYSDNGSNKDAALVRYESDGTLDITFGNNGIVLTDFNNLQQDEIRVVKIHTLSGNIIVGGSYAASSTVSKPVIARYLSNGNLDTSFNLTGINLFPVYTDSFYLYSIEDLAVQSNGKISAIGWRDHPALNFYSDNIGCRINSDGTFDNTFSTDGINLYDSNLGFSDRAYSMILKPDNKILVGGGSEFSTVWYDFAFFEIGSNGVSTGLAGLADFGTEVDDIAYALAEDTDGKFVLAGTATTSITAKTFGISRLNTNGTIDTGFGTGGKVTTSFGGNSLNECFDMLVQPDNKIVAVGYCGNDFALARYTGNYTPQLDNFMLLTPVNQSVNLNYSNLAFNWSDAFGATSYEFQIDNTPIFTGSPQSYTVFTSAKTLTNLLPNTEYFWRVRASAEQNWGEYSDVWSFTTNTLENFNLILPANNSTNQEFVSLSFDWSTATGADEYELELGVSENFPSNASTYGATTSAYTVSDLEPSTTYSWHVRASDGNQWGEWSPTWEFTTKEAVGILEEENTTIKIYPNPTNDAIQMQLNEANIGQLYFIFDVTGQKVAADRIKSTLSIISLNNLSAGIYYLQVGDQSHQKIKIVKQ